MEGYLSSNMKLDYSRIRATFSNFECRQITVDGMLQLPDTRYVVISNWMPDHISVHSLTFFPNNSSLTAIRIVFKFGIDIPQGG